jgi:hypothetical protein
MDIDNRSEGLTDLAYYDQGFFNVIEAHMTYLREHPDTKAYQVTPGEAYMFEADFYGLLMTHSIRAHMHRIILRMNNMTNPNQFTANTVFFLVPDPRTVSQILSTYQTRAK